jgi:hypothetical protein
MLLNVFGELRLRARPRLELESDTPAWDCNEL